MDISIVMATWNNSKRFVVTLGAIKKCVIPPGIDWELIVVNNNCTDDTGQVIKPYLNLLPITYINENRQGLSAARNKGLEAALGRLIIFADDDVTPRFNWITAYWSAFQEKPKQFYFGGPIESEFEKAISVDLLPFAPESVKGFNLGEDPKILRNKEYFLGANWACPREPLQELRGFDTKKGLNAILKKVKCGEETDLMDRLNKMGLHGYYVPEAKIKHFVPIRKCTLKHIAERWEAWGYYQAGDYAAYLKYPQIFGIPRGLFKRGLSLRIKWLIAKAAGHKGFNEYIQYRELIGIVDGLRELKKMNVKR